MSEPSDSENRIKRIIESEKDPKILQALLVQAAGEIERLSREVERLKKEEAQGSQTNFTLEESVRLLRKALYGRSREEHPEASDRPRSESQETALLFSQSAFPAPEMHSEGKGKSKGRELEMVEIDIRATDEELCAESRIRGLSEPSAAQWIDTGLFDQSTKIQIIERRYVREIHRRFKYKLKPQYAPGSEKEIIITANARPA